MQAEIGDYRGPLAGASISLADHGFTYGDAVYETLRTLKGEIFATGAHLKRLRESAEGLYLELPWSDEELTERLESFRKFIGGTDHYLRMIVTRGVAPLGYSSNREQKPQCVLLGGPFRAPQADELGKGMRATVVERLRNSVEALSPALKTNNLLNPRLAAMEANRRGFDEAVMLNARGNFTEGTTCNLFLGRGTDTLVTPDLASGLLPGITRALLLELAREDGMQVVERPIAREEIPHFQEAFLCSTTRTAAGLSHIDDWKLQVDGPVTTRVKQLFLQKYGEL